MSFSDLKSRVVWTNGCFDILHRGHIEMFKGCFELAGPEGVVVVGVDSDERVKSLKGNDRPFNTIGDRVEILRALKLIDVVDVFSTDEELKGLISEVHKPDIMVVGEEYKHQTVIGSEFVDEVSFFPRLGKYSTTDILEYQGVINENSKR